MRPEQEGSVDIEQEAPVKPVDSAKKTSEIEATVDEALGSPNFKEAVDANPDLATEIITDVGTGIKEDPALPEETKGVMTAIYKYVQKHKLEYALASSLLIAASSGSLRRATQDKVDAGIESGTKIVDVIHNKGDAAYASMSQKAEDAGLLWKNSDYKPRNEGAIIIPRWFFMTEATGLNGEWKQETSEEIKAAGIETQTLRTTEGDSGWIINYSPIIKWKAEHPEVSKIVVNSIEGKLISVDFEHYGTKGETSLTVYSTDGKSVQLSGEAYAEQVRSPFDSKLDAKTYQLFDKIAGSDKPERGFGQRYDRICETKSVAATRAMINALNNYSAGEKGETGVNPASTQGI